MQDSTKLLDKAIIYATHKHSGQLRKISHAPYILHPLEVAHILSTMTDDTEVISFLLSTEIIPLCLRTMEMGSELSKTVATFIVQKILLDDVGLDYICTTAERFFAVGRVLGNMVAALRCKSLYLCFVTGLSL